LRERHQAIVFTAVWIGSLLMALAVVSAVVPPPVNRERAVSVALQIRGPGWTIAYAGSTLNNTAFGFIREANLTEGFELRWAEYGWPYNDVFVTSINGTANDGAGNLWWQYCVNGAYASVGAASQAIRSGDRITWAYAAPGGDELCR